MGNTYKPRAILEKWFVVFIINDLGIPADQLGKQGSDAQKFELT
jgi:hypothetical protein